MHACQQTCSRYAGAVKAQVNAGDFTNPPASIAEVQLANYPRALAPDKMDFWPALTRYQRPIWWLNWGLFALIGQKDLESPAQLKGKRIGIPREYRMEGTDQAILDSWEQGKAWLRDAGAEIVDMLDADGMRGVRFLWARVRGK